MGKRPGRNITGKWLHSGGTVVYFLLKLNGSELCLCADSEKFMSLNFSNGPGIISILQIQGPTSIFDLLVLTSLHNLLTFTSA